MTDDVDETPTGDDATGAHLLERVEADPASVDLEDIVSVVTDGDPDEAVVRAFRTWLQAGESDPDRASARVVDLLGDDDYVVRLYAGKLVAELGAEAPAAAAPHVDRLVEVAAGDDIAADAATAALRFVARSEPEAILPVSDRLSDLLDHDLASVREDATVVAARLSADHPGALVELVPDLASAASTGSPSDAEGPTSGAGGQESKSRSGDPDGATGGPPDRGHGGDQNAAFALVRIAAAEPGAVEPHLPDVNGIVDAEGDYATREYLVEAVWRVADARPRAVIDDVDALVSALADETGATPGMRAAAARALTALAAYDGDRVAAAVVETEGAIDACRSLLDEEESRVRGSAASLFAYLAEYEPSAATEASDDLLARLDDDQSVRGSAVWALRFLGPHLDEAAEADVRRALGTVAAEDASREVRQLAADSLDAMSDA